MHDFLNYQFDNTFQSYVLLYLNIYLFLDMFVQSRFFLYIICFFFFWQLKRHWVFALIPLLYNCIMLRRRQWMAPHSSTLAWKIPWREEPGRLQSMGLRRVGHGWGTSLSLFTFMHWRRKWQPTPVFLPGESQGQGSLVGCHLWGHTESDMTEVT